MDTKYSSKNLKSDDNSLSIDSINFKQLSKNCKTQDDLSNLTKQFMKNMIENILKSELEEHLADTRISHHRLFH